MSNSVKKPMNLRARMNRGGAKLAGALTILAGIGLITQEAFVGGAIIVYAGLLAFPLTRVAASGGVLGFTKWRAYAARLLYLGLLVFGAILAYPS